MRRLAAGLLVAGLALSPLAAPAWAAKDKPAQATDKGASTPATPRLKMPDEKTRLATFADYEAQLASGQKARAADALVAILQDPTKAVFHPDASVKLAELLAQLDLRYAALLAYRDAFATADPTLHPTVGQQIPAALELAKKVGDTSVLQAAFAKNMALAPNADVKGQMAYLAAKEAFRQSEYGTAISFLALVPQGDPSYAEAKSLEGIILNQQGRPEEALAALLIAQANASGKGTDFQEMLQINIARTWYAADNFPRAIQSYAAIPRSSTWWPEAQFERSWAHFRMDDFNGTLSLMMTLGTPFFDDFYFPEGDLLRVYSMFYLCKFPSSEKEIEAFKDTYTPIHTAMKGWTSKAPAQVFTDVRRFIESGDAGGLPTMILRPFAVEEQTLATLKAVRAVEDEQKRMSGGASANPFSTWAATALEARRAALVDAEGARILGRVQAQDAQLAEYLSGVEIFTVDILRMKGMLLTQAANTGVTATAAKTVDRKQAVKKNQRAWPYEGELWADELGYYRVRTPAECPIELRQSTSGAAN